MKIFLSAYAGACRPGLGVFFMGKGLRYVCILYPNGSFPKSTGLVRAPNSCEISEPWGVGGYRVGYRVRYSKMAVKNFVRAYAGGRPAGVLVWVYVLV